jgi:hypothetical protein
MAGFLRNRLCHDQSTAFLYNDLGVSGLDKSICPFQDERFRVAEIILNLLGGFALLGYPVFFTACFTLFPRSPLQSPFSFTNAFQPCFSSAQFLGKFVGTLVLSISDAFFIIRRLELGQQLADFPCQRPSFLLHASVTHPLAFRSASFHIRAIHRRVAQIDGARFQHHPQHLLKKSLHRLLLNLAGVRNSTEIGPLACGHKEESHVLRKALLNLPRRNNPGALPINQHPRHHLRLIRRLAALLLFIIRLNVWKLDLVDHAADEADQLVLRKPLLQPLSQQ